MNHKTKAWVPWAVTLLFHGMVIFFLQTAVTGSQIPSVRIHPKPVFVGAILTPSSLSIPPASADASETTTLPPIPEDLFEAGPSLEAARIRGFQPEFSHDEPGALRWNALPEKLFGFEKQYPHAVTAVVTPKSASTPVWIRGPARRRALVERPPMSSFVSQVRLTRLRSKDISNTVEIELRFTLLMSGQVDRVEIIRSSGDPLLDLMGSRYLKEWKFSALDPQDVRIHGDAWGRVTLRLDLESPESSS